MLNPRRGWGFLDGASGKDPACQCRRLKKRGFDSWVRKISWRKTWQPTPVFLPGESPGQRSLAGYSPKGHKEWDTTKATYPAMAGSEEELNAILFQSSASAD